MEQSQLTGATGGALQGAAAGASFGPYGAVIGGVIGGIGGFFGGGGEKKAKKAAKMQAQEILRAAAENKRVQTLVMNQAVSTAKVATYASNLIDRGSTRRYRMALEAEYRRGIDYDYEAAVRRANTVRQYGAAAANQIQRAGFGQLIYGFSALGEAGAKAGWFSSGDPSAGLGYIRAGSGGRYTTDVPMGSLLVRK